MSIRVENTGSSSINLRNAPKVNSGGSAETAAPAKSIGETPPTIVSLAEIGTLAALFSKGGTVSKLRRRLNKLKRKNCRVTPALGTIACVDANDLVYLGVEFLREYHDQEDVLAGVMAHEWGHTCAEKPTQKEMNILNWDQIFELRKSHEVLADEISGRMLALMGYKPDGLIKFLTEKLKDTHNLKYHDKKTRAQIILGGYKDEQRKIKLAGELFPQTGYANNYHSKIIDDDI